MTLPLTKRQKMTAKMLLFTVFCCVSGGPYGLEGLIGSSGAGFGLVLILVIPLLWAVPDALVTAELASALPVEGGYYQWVKRAIGIDAAFLNGWWTWIYAMIDASLYPIYFAQSLSLILKSAFGVTALERSVDLRWAVSLAVIAAFTWLNIRGTRAVGKASEILAGLIILPFLVMGAAALWRWGAAPTPLNIEPLPDGETFSGALVGGLGIAMWNYLGWDSLSTIAEEVEEPQKAFPMALLWGVPLVTGIYLIATLSGLAFLPDIRQWQEGAWPAIAKAVGGAPLFWLVSLGAAMSSMALFTATFLGASRLPFVLAQDRFLPEWLIKSHPRFGTPYRSILLCAVVYAMLSRLFSWQELVSVNVVLYAIALVMEAVSLIILRVREPGLLRPFRIPGGMAGAVLAAASPTLMIVVLIGASIWEDGWGAVFPTAACLLSGFLFLAGTKVIRNSRTEQSPDSAQ